MLVLRPVLSAWGFLYVPFLIGACFYFAKAAGPGMRAMVVWAALTGFFAVVGRGEPSWFTPSWMGVMLGGSAVTDPGKLYAVMIAVGLAIWLGLSGTGWLLAMFWGNRVRMKAEEHLMGIAHENDLKRKEIQERTGGAVGDRDFALGDQGEGEGEER